MGAQSNISDTLSGKTILIVGGTSGIGLAAATQAKSLGAKVIVVGSDAERARQAAEQHGLSGWRAADVTKRAAIESALADIEHVDHLVLLAGSFVVGQVLEADVDHLRRAFEERVWAAIYSKRVGHPTYL
ncbi:SDR family NAD(P)-dependent oxidoreductase [Rhizobium binae]